MPQLLFLALLGAGAYTGYRLARKKVRDTQRATAERAKPAEPRDLGALRKDPVTGDYRPG